MFLSRWNKSDKTKTRTSHKVTSQFPLCLHYILDIILDFFFPNGKIGPEKCEFTADGLTPKKKYKFRVKAVNKEGESDALESDEPITARNPYGKIAALSLHSILFFSVSANSSAKIKLFMNLVDTIIFTVSANS